MRPSMSSEVLFSIVIPVYNRETMIGRAIESVLIQSYPHYELLVIDDGSVDNTKMVIEDYSKRDARIKPIYLSENKGRCFARNAGIENATGNWICHLDSDDEYYPHHLNFLYDKIQSLGSIKAIAVNQHLNGKMNPENSLITENFQGIWDIKNFISKNPITANQLCYAADLEVRWSDERIPIAEDLLFIRNLVLKTPIAKFTEYTVNMHDHQSRTIYVETAEGAENFVFYNLLAAEKFVQENKLDKWVVNQIMSNTFLLCANVFLSQGYKKKALPLFSKGCLYFSSYFNPLFYKAILKLLFK